MAADTASERAAAMRLAATGDIRSAIGILRALAEASDDPEDRLLLGRIAFLATDYAEAQAQLEHAYREFQVRGLPRRAAMAATTLGGLHFNGLEDQVVGGGWFARALRLLEHEEQCVERGYAVLGLMGASVASAEELEANARIALDLAHRFLDRNLECKALGDSGLALVSMGHIKDGMARLDEAFTTYATLHFLAVVGGGALFAYPVEAKLLGAPAHPEAADIRAHAEAVADVLISGIASAPRPRSDLGERSCRPAKNRSP